MNEFWESFFSVPNSQIKATIIIVIALIIIFIALNPVFKKLNPASKTPLWAVPFVWIVDLINGFVKSNIGKRWKSYAPWFLSLTIILFFSNISNICSRNSLPQYTFTISDTFCEFLSPAKIVPLYSPFDVTTTVRFALK